jgi:signal recognition particle subunit SRP54
MFGALTDKLQNLFSSLSGQKTLSETNIADAVREVRLALLDADVNYSVATVFVNRVKEKALGASVLKSIDPRQQFIQIVHDELISLMGGEEVPLDLKGKLSVIMLCGLQGSGKTTTCAKLAKYIQLHEKHKKILLVACDLQRPAAVEQLKKLGASIGVDVFSIDGEKRALVVAQKGYEKAKIEGFDVLIVDTAGRLHVDDVLMQELSSIASSLDPREVLFVANATTGQDAVKVAAEFDKKVPLTGTILTMLDGNTRAGAAISIREITQKPLRFEGIGEKVSDLQLFSPRSMADRILGMGDVINLVKKAQIHFDEAENLKMEKKLKTATFTYDDYLKQMGMIKKMGSVKSLLKMIPGLSSFGDLDFSDQQFARMEAMILSMTPDEREEKEELSHGRRKRISKGSGVDLEEVNRMVKGFKRVKQLVKGMPDMKSKMKGFSGMPDLKELKNQLKGNQWR